MSNSLLTIGMITQEALMVLENSLTFTKRVNRQYDDSFAKKGAKIGDTINVRKPIRPVGRRTPTFNPENIAETAVPVTLTTQYGTDFSFTTNEQTLSIDDFSDRIIKPAVAVMSNMIDYDGMQLYKQIYNNIGTPGTTPSANLTYLQAGSKLDDNAVPRDGYRSLCINPDAQATIVNANLALFNPQKNISGQYEKGLIGSDTLGFDWYMDQNVGVQTVGTYAANVAGGAVTVTTDSTTATVVTGGWTAADALNLGDIVTFAGVYSVNPQSRVSTGKLMQFVLTANAVASGGGSMTMVLSPAPVFSGQFQNVTGASAAITKIAATSVVSVYGASAKTSPQNLAFHRDAFTFATTDLEIPMGSVNASRVRSKQLGMSIRMVPFYDGTNDRSNVRLDLLGGWAVLRPELAVRVSG